MIDQKELAELKKKIFILETQMVNHITYHEVTTQGKKEGKRK